MRNLLIIGDVHGKLSYYQEILQSNNYDYSYQIGDFGFKHEYDKFEKSADNNFKNKILMGNHDYYPYLYKEYVLGDYGYENGIFFIRGAHSIDYMYRIEGRDLFHNEELSYLEGLNMLNSYEKIKPRIVITHDCPQFICTKIFDIAVPSKTRQLLDAAFEIHAPDMWIFGHHHKSVDVKIGKTNFRCLKELEFIKI